MTNTFGETLQFGFKNVITNLNIVKTHADFQSQLSAILSNFIIHIQEKRGKIAIFHSKDKDSCQAPNFNCKD